MLGTDVVRNLFRGLIAGWLLVGTAAAADNDLLHSSLGSIQADDLKKHTDVLSDDTFEGREAGLRGGRAAGNYLIRHFQQFGLQGGAAGGAYFQTFNAGYRNLLGLLEGRDPQLRNEVIILGAHYDHVGYGNQSNSFGPFGYVHNGADDNASGTAGLLETIEAFSKLGQPPRRSVLFALWDGEEKGLLGSKHWLANPTLNLKRLRFVVNVDMIGRLRNRRLEVYGTRTSTGLRRLMSHSNQGVGLDMLFTWEMKDNSDHYPFYQRGIPVMMLHTGLHDEYHRPSDDAHTLNAEGMQEVVRVLFRSVYQLAEQPQLGGFRMAARSESTDSQRQFEAPLPPRPPRLGITFSRPQKNDPGLVVTNVQIGSAAARGGLRVGDRIVRFAGEEIESQDQLIQLTLRASEPTEIVVRRPGNEEPLRSTIQLAGRPVRVGISWREDQAEPHCVMLTQVIAGSPAQQAGLRVRDRIWGVAGQEFQGSQQLFDLLSTLPSPVMLTVESRGQLRDVSLDIPGAQQPAMTAGG